MRTPAKTPKARTRSSGEAGRQASDAVVIRPAVPEPSGAAAEDPPERSVLTLIRDLQSGACKPAILSIEDRRRCVEHLTAEGCMVPEIADLLKVDERTIRRDRKLIRSANALRHDPEFVPEMLGSLVGQAERSIARLLRLVRDRDSPPAVKVEAAKACWQVQRELVQSLQSLGYLPTAAQEIRGHLTHGLNDDDPTLPDVAQELARLRLIVDEVPPSPQSAGSEVHSGNTHTGLAGRVAEAGQIVSGLAARERVPALLPQTPDTEHVDDHQ